MEEEEKNGAQAFLPESFLLRKGTREEIVDCGLKRKIREDFLTAKNAKEREGRDFCWKRAADASRSAEILSALGKGKENAGGTPALLEPRVKGIDGRIVLRKHPRANIRAFHGKTGCPFRT